MLQPQPQRVEQCGNRIVISSGGVIHDTRADGTEENGVNDVAARDFTTPIVVVATYTDGDGNMIWEYLGTTATLARIGEPTDAPPSA